MLSEREDGVLSANARCGCYPGRQWTGAGVGCVFSLPARGRELCDPAARASLHLASVVRGPPYTGRLELLCVAVVALLSGLGLQAQLRSGVWDGWEVAVGFPSVRRRAGVRLSHPRNSVSLATSLPLLNFVLGKNDMRVCVFSSGSANKHQAFVFGRPAADRHGIFMLGAEIEGASTTWTQPGREEYTMVFRRDVNTGYLVQEGREGEGG